ncbi:four helix bundle protein [Geminocystis sp. CENA526]|uniref:four helix bundle protein n=1 Tax=Geminocystis sp. CENA526 TaxID=1355871 RepID=UPI003D6F5D20
MKDNIIKQKSFDFALRIIKLSQYLKEEKKEYILSKQILRSGTSIGAMISRLEYVEDDTDFIETLNIAIKNTNHSLYWLKLLHTSNYLNDKGFTSIYADLIEIKKILVSISKTAKNNHSSFLIN